MLKMWRIFCAAYYVQPIIKSAESEGSWTLLLFLFLCFTFIIHPNIKNFQ